MKEIYILGMLFLGFLSVTLSDGLTRELQENAPALYQQALELSLNEDWAQATQLFEQLIETSQKSEYHDDAYFWMGYCLEHTSPDPAQAYQAFQTLIDSFPGSSWREEALLKQIRLAEQLTGNDQNEYTSFLHTQLGNERALVRQQAALALGRLGDTLAVPVLRQMITKGDHSAEARQLLTELAPDEANIEAATPGDQARMRESGTDSSRIPPSKIPLFGALTTEHRAYKTMLKQDNQWSQQELLDFAMWYVLRPGEFKQYFNQSGEDREAWLVKEWAEVDPVPETPRNEALQEFERRIQYAREHFAGFWNFKQVKYLPEQYQREGWANAPWDARGEIYIKYGEPDFVTVGDDLNEVHWTYYRHNIDFVIRKYMTNIYGNAILIGELARNMYRYDLENMTYRFIEEKRFVYP
ncbi:MAG TPA: GWxTD domain-containing protein [bacterium]|nr:GWxTD domain-containing protein [bacterium]